VGKIKLSTNCKGQGPLEEKRRDLLPDPKERVIIGQKKTVIHPTISKERVIGGGKKGKDGGGGWVPHIQKEREQIGRQKENHKCWSGENSSQNRQLKMLNLIAQKWQVTNCKEKCVFARVKACGP